MGAPLTLQRAGAAVWCTLDRPPLNLFEPTLIRAVRDTFAELAADRATRVVVGVGSGEHFLASDPAALVGYADKVVYLQDQQLCVLVPDDWHILDADRLRVDAKQ